MNELKDVAPAPAPVPVTRTRRLSLSLFNGRSDHKTIHYMRIALVEIELSDWMYAEFFGMQYYYTYNEIIHTETYWKPATIKSSNYEYTKIGRSVMADIISFKDYRIPWYEFEGYDLVEELAKYWSYYVKEIINKKFGKKVKSKIFNTPEEVIQSLLELQSKGEERNA